MEINEEKLKNILTEQREEYQRYLGAVTEDFKEQIKGVAESVEITKETLTQKIDEANKKLDLHTETIGEIKVDITTVKEDVKNIKEKLEKHDEKIKTLEEVV